MPFLQLRGAVDWLQSNSVVSIAPADTQINEGRIHQTFPGATFEGIF